MAKALAEARALGLDRLDAQLLLALTVSRSRTWLLTHDDSPIEDAQLAAYLERARRRARGVPLAYITGQKEFHGLKLRVDPGVLVPRPDTETLVDWALELLATDLSALHAPRVIDLGTGSGAIALAVKQGCPRARLTAVDVSEAALQTARANGEALGLSVDWRLGHWWGAVDATQAYELALSNPPYIAEGDPHLAALGQEPQLALRSGADGLDALREIVANSPAHLQPGGWLLLEHGHDQGARVHDLLVDAGFADIRSRRDLAGLWRCSGGRRVASVTNGRK